MCLFRADELRASLGSYVELKPILTVGEKSAETREGRALSTANALEDIVENTVELIGGGGGGDVRLFR
jgi:hypothetical protein